MASEEYSFLIITKLDNNINKENLEFKLLYLFRKYNEEIICKIPIKRYKNISIIDGWNSLPDTNHNPFQTFWSYLKTDFFITDDEATNQILKWYKKLDNNHKQDFHSIFNSFFQSLLQNKTYLNLLIHIGGDEGRAKLYPNYLQDFFNQKFPSYKIKITPLSSTENPPETITFNDLLGEEPIHTLPTLENNLIRHLGLQQKLYQVLNQIRKARTLKQAEIYYNQLSALKPKEFPLIKLDELIAIRENEKVKFKAIYPKIIFNGFLTNPPFFLKKIFSSDNNEKLTINIIFINPDRFPKGVTLKDKTIYELSDAETNTVHPSFNRPTIFVSFFNFISNKKYIYAMDKWWDPRYRFFDSCIWFRHISLRFANQAEEVLEDIKKYWQRGVYTLGASKEFLDFQIRLFNNSYIQRIGREGHHNGHVTPFSFHSESKMKIAANRELENLDNYEWNILVIDDYVNKPLSQNSNRSKASIIKEVLGCTNNAGHYTSQNKRMDDRCIINYNDSSIKVNFKYANCIEGEDKENSALDLIQDLERYYDIILLDFLFEHENKTVEYGQKFILDLERIIDINKWDKVWIMPISVYQNALTDNLRNELIPLYHKHLIISEGADPICTPELFRYKFFNFLSLQKDELIKSKAKNKTFKELLEVEKQQLGGFNKKVNDMSIQQWAADVFPSIVQLGINFNTLCHYQSISAFANSALENDFFKLKNKEDWLHIQNFFYLLAYGNKYQFPQIMKEQLYIFKTTLKSNDLFNRLNELIINYLLLE